MAINRDSICMKCGKLRIVSKDGIENGPIVLVECKDGFGSFPIKSGNSCPYFIETCDEMKGENHD